MDIYSFIEYMVKIERYLRANNLQPDADVVQAALWVVESRHPELEFFE
jgi:hypothetical protein